MPSTTILYAPLGRTLGILDGDQICSDARSAQFSGRKKATPPLSKLQMWNAFLSMRQYSLLLPNFRFRFRFRFRLCPSFRGVPLFRDPPCISTGTGTSRNHLASLHFTVRHLRWIPHVLTAEQKQIRVQMAIKLFQVLSAQSTPQ
jgi:hypothetical protein